MFTFIYIYMINLYLLFIHNKNFIISEIIYFILFAPFSLKQIYLQLQMIKF